MFFVTPPPPTPEESEREERLRAERRRENEIYAAYRPSKHAEWREHKRGHRVHTVLHLIMDILIKGLF